MAERLYHSNGELHYVDDKYPRRKYSHLVTTSSDWWQQRDAAKETQQTEAFSFLDFDGELIEVETRIEEREWARGEGWCRWLSWFIPNKIARSLDLSFTSQVGHKKGSWKGGTLGHGIDLLPNEHPLSAFKRYCKANNLTFVDWLDRPANFPKRTESP